VMVGGGVRGGTAGIALNTITQVGSIIKAFHLFMRGYLQIGGMTIGIINGEVASGITNKYPTSKFKGTGAVGRTADIGSNKLGVSKV